MLLQSTARPRNAGVNEVVCNRQSSSEPSSLFAFFYSILCRLPLPISFRWSWNCCASSSNTFNQMNQKLQDSYEAFRSQETLNFIIVKSYVPAKGTSQLCNLAMIVTEPQNVLQTVQKGLGFEPLARNGTAFRLFESLTNFTLLPC